MRTRNVLQEPRPNLLLAGAALILSVASPTSAQDFADLNPPIVEDIPDGFVLIDGDMLLPEESVGQTAAAYQTNLWPSGIVRFEFDDNVTAANRTAMISAMGFWEAVANVQFLPRLGGELFFVHIQSSTGNNSQVGMIAGGQVINIVSWGSPYIIAHELGHCLGFIHEHQRGDRDSFVSITAGNVQGGFGNQVSLLDPLVYGPYDFDSLMHYDGCSFSVCCPAGSTCNCSPACQTITVLPANNAQWQSQIGQRTHLSYWDALVMSFAYPPSDWRFQRNSSGNDVVFPGAFLLPYSSFGKGYAETPPGGTLWILEPSSHAVGPVLDKPMTIGAPLGGVILTR
jgi:hypothetical protein